jgi:hypothetical protein
MTRMMSSSVCVNLRQLLYKRVKGLVRVVAFSREIRPEAFVLLGDVFAFRQCGRVDVLCHDFLNITGDTLPGSTVNQEPPAVPHVIG